MRSETQPYSTVIAIRLCRTAHAIFFPKFWNDKTNFTTGGRGVIFVLSMQNFVKVLLTFSLSSH